jgi:16S rRNA (adenine1518-N6/adenine1519-N6)-dimethyltransferase
LHQKNELVREWLALANIDASRRAETLSVDEWLQLWRAIEQASR